LSIIRRKDTDGILVANEPKHGDRNYIGANAFAEIAIAFNAQKAIYLLNDIPAAFEDELSAWGAIPLKGDLSILTADMNRLLSQPKQTPLF
jgi:hypothetical protein